MPVTVVFCPQTEKNMATGDVNDSLLEDDQMRFSIIRDPYKIDAHVLEALEEQLETYFESQIEYIVIEPNQIGNETSKWIQVGNFLHKTSVVSSLTCLFTAVVCPRRFLLYIIIPSATINLFCTCLYNISWQYDPCCKYQIERNRRILERLQLQTLSETTPLVLVRRDDLYRKRLQNIFSLFVFSYVSWKAVRFYFSS